MMRLMAAALALLVGCGWAHAQSSLIGSAVPSKHLGRSFPYLVYLPDGYQRSGMRYPVLYLLHGAGGDETTWSTEGAIQATADRLIGAGTIPPTIIVMPGCRGCWWVDGAVDKAETAFWDEMVPQIAKRYRVIEGRKGRLVAGLSAGGYGAVRFAMRHPDKIAAAAALSPAVYAETPPAISSARVQPPFLKNGAFDEAAWRARNYTASIDGYFRQPNKVAFYLMSGDNDKYGIAFETMTLFKRLYDRQPEVSELRIVDGDHTWTLWARSIENAMRYLYKHAEAPSVLPSDLIAKSLGRSTAPMEREPVVANARGTERTTAGERPARSAVIAYFP
jgi:enterochelin esterase-like enzyme